MAKNSERTYVKVAISETKQLPCELVGKNPKNLDACENCRFYMQTWIALKCNHKVCYECFNESTSFICPKEHNRTTKAKASPECNDKLKNSQVYCPGCAEKQTCGNIGKHIRLKHSELLENADESIIPPQREAMARSPTAPQRYEEKKVRCWGKSPQAHGVSETLEDTRTQCDVDMMTDDDSSDSVPPISDEAPVDIDIGTCRHCNTALERKDIPEHEEKCPDRSVQCPFCCNKIAFKTLQWHMNTACPVRKEQAMGTSRTPSTGEPIDDSKESKERRNVTADVQEMKDKLKELEQRMIALEKPLQLIIHKLSSDR